MCHLVSNRQEEQDSNRNPYQENNWNSQTLTIRTIFVMFTEIEPASNYESFPH